MRLRSGLTAVLLALCCVEGALGNPALERRQDNHDVTQTHSPVPSSTHSVVSSATATSSVHSSSFPASSHVASSQVHSSATHTVSGTSSIASATATHATHSASPTSIPLPIQPTITPAIGISGFLLMVAGIALTLIGIKHKWLHIFLSVMLLAALAVTVLIIYVMSPPVSHAIEGAYFVAAFMTGCILGAVSLIFKEVTEGFGCLLGGFCLGMWFLVLQPGGLIQSTAGRAILIAAFSVAGWCLAFSHYTRNYGLIVMTSFAGATVTILGIDCFSRAGLKEFWIYLWNLNDNEFPIGTNTYPITRGIRVEIACIIVIFLFGIMSQVKIWRIVKERRAKKAEERARDGLDRDQQDEAAGKAIEARTEIERAHWERLYGEKSETRVSQVNLDSGVGSSIDTSKHAESIHDREIDEVEMGPLPKRLSRRGSNRNSRGISRLSMRSPSQDIARYPAESQEDLLHEENAPTTERNSLETDSRRASSTTMSLADRSRRNSARDGPPVPPLPFALTANHLRNGSKSTQNSSTRPESGINEFDFGIPHVDDDRASSIAATADDADRFSQHRLSQFNMPYDLNPAKDGALDAKSERAMSPTRKSVQEDPVEEDDEEALEKPAPPLEEPVPASPALSQKRDGSPRRKSWASARDGKTEDGKASVVGDLSEHLPQTLSKVALTYRTNEWAKHITEADMPEHDEVRSTSPGIQVDPVFAEEAARPVDVEALKESTFEAPKPAATMPPKSPKRASTAKSTRASRRSSNGSMTPVYAFQRTGSQTSLAHKASSNSLRRQSSATDLTSPAKTPGRNIAGIMSQTVLESPAEDAQSAIYRQSTASAMTSSNNLLDQREGIIQTKPATTSFFSPSKAPSEAGYFMSPTMSPDMVMNEEDMTLAQRKSMMKNGNPITSPTRHPSTPGRMSGIGGTLTSPSVIYDSHQPKRNNTVDGARQSAALAHWRESLATDGQSKQSPVMLESAKQAMLTERRQADLAKQRRKTDRENRDSIMEQAMRSGQMNTAHRDAMRRMQAKANKQ